MQKRTLGVLMLAVAFGLLGAGCGSKVTENVQQSEEIKSTEVVTEAITESTEVTEFQEQTEAEELKQTEVQEQTEEEWSPYNEVEVRQDEVLQSSDTQSSDSASESQSTDSQPAAPSNDNGESNNAGNTASEELPSNPYPLNTLVEDTGSSVSYYILTEPGHGGIDLSMERQANTYIMNMGKMPVDNGGDSYGTMCGIYKEGAVWKYTIYYN